MNRKLVSQSHVTSLFGIGMLLAATLCCGDACERDMTVTVVGKNPPTFNLSGNGNLHFFTVSEIATENTKSLPAQRKSELDVILWQIWPHDLSFEDTRIWRLPAITYGTVPSGFIQKVPAVGTPSPLIEGKMYEAGGPAANANGGFVLFTIRNGEAVVLDPHY
jgi:hypothetical protein